jgi:hypothetical protein
MPAAAGFKIVRAKLAAGTVRPGGYVVLDTNGKCAHPSAAPTAATRGGIALRNMYRDNDAVYAAGDMVDVLVEGEVWVDAEAAVTMNANAFVRIASGAGGTNLGALRTDADTATASAVPGLYFRTTLAAAGVAKLEVHKSAA